VPTATPIDPSKVALTRASSDSAELGAVTEARFNSCSDAESSGKIAGVGIAVGCLETGDCDGDAETASVGSLEGTGEAGVRLKFKTGAS
jgi:hypothetical protein